ncbi:MAG: GNAT family protein [Bacteroidota bacterium]
MMNTFLDGDSLALRAITMEDASEEYLSWLNDPETTKGLETGKFPQTMDQLESYISAMMADRGVIMLAIIEKSSGRHIGNIKLHNFDWISRTGELGILIGNKSVWGKGYGHESCKLIVAYAFDRLNLRKVWLAVYANNPAAIHIYQKLGFEEEGKLKAHVFSGAAYVDKIFMGLFAQDYASKNKA